MDKILTSYEYSQHREKEVASKPIREKEAVL